VSWLGLTVASLLLGCGEGDKGLSQAICRYHVTDFSLPDLAGRPHRVREYLDRGPVLLFFFTSWCPFCRSEIPQLKEIERERDALGVRLVAIGAGLNDTVETVRRYAVQHRLPYVVLYDDESAVSARFGVKAVPAAFLVRQDGCMTALGSRVTASSLKPFL